MKIKIALYCIMTGCNADQRIYFTIITQYRLNTFVNLMFKHVIYGSI